ncbi:MAG TPA: hypothetical protein VE244_15545 [Nitrososphaeraceae archaeon]|nr:hypothetical protein [Nitrososphaeraceae archaeon]
MVFWSDSITNRTKVLPTYLVRIPPGAAQQDSPEHYYPPNIATLLAQQ